VVKVQLDPELVLAGRQDVTEVFAGAGGAEDDSETG
jgi:hypothetical protein